MLDDIWLCASSPDGLISVPLERNQLATSTLMVTFVPASTTRAGSNSSSTSASTELVKMNVWPLKVPSTRTLLPRGNVGLAAKNWAAPMSPLSTASTLNSTSWYEPAGIAVENAVLTPPLSGSSTTMGVR